MSKLQESQLWFELQELAHSLFPTPDLGTMRQTFAAGRHDCDSTQCRTAQLQFSMHWFEASG
jgi:hypothetical protein